METTCQRGQPATAAMILLSLALCTMPPPAVAAQRCTSLAAAVAAAQAQDPANREVAAAATLAEAIDDDARSWMASGASVYGSWISDGPTDEIGLREYEGGLNLPLRLPGEHAALATESAASLALANGIAASRQLIVAGQVREALWSVATRQAAVAMFEHELEHLMEIDALVEAQVLRGDAAELDRDLTRAAVDSASADLAIAQGEAAAALHGWRYLTGCAALPDAAPEPRAAAQDPPEDHALRALADANVDQARAQLAVAQARPAAMPTLGFMVRRERGGAQAPWIDAVGVNLTLPIGTSGSRVRARGEAARAAEAAAAERMRTLRALASAADTARARLQASEVALQAAQRRSAHTETALLRAEKAWRAGAWDTIELLRVAGMAAEARLAALQARLAVGLATARLNQAIGVLP